MIARTAKTDDAIQIAGMGAVFNSWYPVYGFKERVAPGAFAKTLRENPDIRGMFNHDPNFLLGRTKSGTMTVEETDKGLAYDIQADPDDPQAQSVARKIARGDVDGSSMAFFVHKEEWKEDHGKPIERTITEVELIETGPVTMPASPSTTAKIQRSFDETGIDYDALRGLVVMRRAGFRLTMAQDDLIAKQIAQLERLKSEPDSLEHHSDTGTSPGYGGAAWAMRKRLIDALAA